MGDEHSTTGAAKPKRILAQIGEFVSGLIGLAILGAIIYFAGPWVYYQFVTETVKDFGFEYHESRFGGHLGMAAAWRGQKTVFIDWEFINKGKDRLDDVDVTITLFYEGGERPEEKKYWGAWDPGEKKTISTDKWSYEKMQKLEMKGTAKKGSRKVNLEFIVYKKDMKTIEKK